MTDERARYNDTAEIWLGGEKLGDVEVQLWASQKRGETPLGQEVLLPVSWGGRDPRRVALTDEAAL